MAGALAMKAIGIAGAAGLCCVLWVGCASDRSPATSSGKEWFKNIDGRLFVSTPAFGGPWGSSGDAWVGLLNHATKRALVHHRPTKAECYFSLNDYGGPTPSDGGDESTDVRYQIAEAMRYWAKASNATVTYFKVASRVHRPFGDEPLNLEFLKSRFEGEVNSTYLGGKHPTTCVIYVAPVKRESQPTLYFTGNIFIPKGADSAQREKIIEATERFLSGMGFTQ